MWGVAFTACVIFLFSRKGCIALYAYASVGHLSGRLKKACNQSKNALERAKHSATKKAISYISGWFNQVLKWVPCISAIFGCHTILRVYQSETVLWAHSARTYHRELERAWRFDTTWDSPFQQDYDYLSHTFWCTSGDCSSWLVGWQKKKSQACVPLYLCLDISNNLGRALSCLRLLAITFWSK